MKKIHLLENALRYLLDEGRNAEKAKQKTIAVIKSYLSQNGIQGGQLETMAMEYESSFKEWLFHANMPDSIIRLEPIMANVAMQLGFTPQNRSTRELYRLKDITNYIIANYNKEDFPIALNKLTLDNTTFESLNELFGSAIDTSKGVWKPSNDGKPKPHYTVKRLDTFEEAHKYHRYTQDICYLGGEGTWNRYTDNGKNAVYVLLRDGWQDVLAEHGEDTPYDDYGKSMVFVIIRPDGDVAYTNTRWNHDTEDKGPIDVDQSFTENMNDVSDMLQTDYRNVLKPYTEEELVEKGFITLSMLRQWLADGKDISELCKRSKQVLQVSDNLFEIKLSIKNIMLYNSYLKKFMPYDNARLQSIGYFEDGYAIIQRQDKKRTFINAEGQQICGWYNNVRKFYNGFASVQREDGKMSFINTEDQQIGDWYKYVDDFNNDGFARVQREDGKWSFINTEGQQIGDWYWNVRPFRENYARVQREDDKMSFINTEGQQICDWYDEVDDFKNGFARVVREDGKMSFINTEGQQICDWYKYIEGFKNGFARVVREDGKMSFINTEGQQICDWYKYVNDFKNGFARVQREDGKMSFINTEGQQICDWYDNIYGFGDDGFAVVENNNMQSIINTKGQRICSWYSKVSDFYHGFAIVTSGKKQSFINTEGQQIGGWHKRVTYFKNGFAEVEGNDGKWYYMDTKGNLYNASKQPISVQNENYNRLNNLIAEALYTSIKKYLLYN